MLCDVCQTSYLRSDCPHLIGWRTDSGAIVTGTYGGDPNLAEMIEGSIVFMAAQQHARLIKSVQEGRVDPKALAITPYGEDLVLLKEAEGLARAYGHAMKSWAFPALQVAPAGESAPQASGDGSDSMPTVQNEKAMDAGNCPRCSMAACTMAQSGECPEMPEGTMSADVQARVGELEQAGQARSVEVETLKGQLVEREPLAAIGEKALAAVHEELLRHYVRLERGPDFDALAKHWLDARDFDHLVAARDAAQAEMLARFPAGISGEPPAPEDHLGSQPAAFDLNLDPDLIRRELLAR